MAQEKAKLQFAKAMDALMESKPVCKIHVCDLLQESGLSRQTFYRHFRDIYDLINWMHVEKTRLAFDLFDFHGDLQEGLCVSLTLMLKNRTFYRQIISLEGYNSFYNTYYARCKNNMAQFVQKRTALDEDILFSIRFVSAGITQMLVEWIQGGMVELPEVMAKGFVENMPTRLQHACGIFEI